VLFRSLIALSLAIVLSSPGHAAAQTVKTGAQVLSEEGFQPLKGKKFGLITNQSAMVGGAHLLDLLARSGVPPTVVFTPEHGLKGKAEDGVRIADDSIAGIPIKSLYGAGKKPHPEDLKGLDLLVFDIQDVGVRFYTYISTMGLAMQAAAEAGIPFLVLDRPNPLGGEYVAGFLSRATPPTFTSFYPIPIAHGMTVGELAELIKGEALLPGLAGLQLEVVPMQGWLRAMRWPDTGLPWVATSPNLAEFGSVLLYPGTGLLEGTAASEGRGCPHPFRVVGWPGLDSQALAKTLNDEELPGLHFEPTRFTPVSLPGIASDPKYKNRELGGVEIEITDYREVQPVETGTAVICALYAAIPDAGRTVFFKRGGFDDMTGSEAARKAVQAGRQSDEIAAEWHGEVQHFLELRRRYLLYH